MVRVKALLSANHWLDPYVWVEVFCVLFYFVLAPVVMFGALSFMHPLFIGMWYGPQVLFPVWIVSSVFVFGRPPQSQKAAIETRYKVHMALAVITGILSLGANLAFVGIQIAYATTDSCNSGVDTPCQHLMAFVFLMVMVLFLVVLDCLILATLLLSWIKHENRRGESRTSE